MEPYATDLTDSQWELIEPPLPAPNRRGRPRTLDRRQIVNAIFYLLRTGNRLPMAYATPRHACLEHRLRLLSSMAA
jgi:transposase